MATSSRFVGALLLFVLAVAAPAHAVDVQAVRLWAGPDGTRVVLDLSGSAQHSLAVLRNPDRVVLDVSGARLARGARAAPAAAGAVKQVRMAKRPSGELRIVLDLSRQIRAKSFLAVPNNHYGYRLVIDLTGAAADTPVKVEHARPDARDLIIAIDAGHGGEDPGAIGKNGTREKDVVLAIARALAQRVNSEPGMKAVLTRDGDYFVPLRDRMRRARAQQADLFVSIHADSIRDRSVDGSSVYILSQRGATDEASRWLAERENASDLIGGVSLDDKGDVLASVLLDLSQSASLSASQVAAEHVLHQLNQVGEIRKPQVQQARFMVLKSPDIPSMLVETAYISNPREEQRLRGAAQQAKLAAAIHQGVRAYFYADPPAGTRIAELAGAGAPRPVLATAAARGGAGD
ncbi:MAG TPA: N-acetylmuramoyl-L-alanine amidase [Steroidobacteraceae bacterium]|nr:N-acetylmuramoyl-L-alanine amidase [Steroidobacteraceae bacterium]